MNTDERGSFLKKEFFSCASKDTCSHVVRLKGTAEYKEVYSHQLPSEEAVIYEKIKVSTGLGKLKPFNHLLARESKQ